MPKPLVCEVSLRHACTEVGAPRCVLNSNEEKTMQKYQQLAKDAQSNGDPVLVENYLQHADHYSRRLAELNERSKDNSINDKSDNSSNSTVNDDLKSSN